MRKAPNYGILQSEGCRIIRIERIVQTRHQPGGAPQKLHVLSPGLIVCLQYEQGCGRSAEPHFGHQENSGVIAVLHTGQETFVVITFASGISVVRLAEASTTGIRR